MALDMTLEEQREWCLPFIEEERRAFIKADYGRLQGAMNSEYWDAASGTYRIFHELPELNEELGEMGDPYELQIEEIFLLTTLEKRIERMGTYSYMALYPVYPEDRERLSLLSGIKTRLDLGRPCSDEEFGALVGRHDDYLRRKADDGVRVIM